LNALKIAAYLSLTILTVPLAVLLYEGLGPLSTPIGYSSAVFRSIGLTLLASALAAAVDVLIFTPLSYYLARTHSPLAETLTDIPAIVPHPIVGVALLLLTSPLTPLGTFLSSIGLSLYNTLTGLVVALVVVSAPIYTKAMKPFFESMSVEPEVFALGLGASRFRVFRSVALPNSGLGVLSASLIAMSRAMSEFGSVAILVFYVLQPPFNGVSPASVLVFDYYTYYGLGAAVTASAVMILISLALMVPVRLIGSASNSWRGRASVGNKS
jgi:molybdate/tungstate transport system permease protein